MIQQTNELHFPLDWEFRIIIAEAGEPESMIGIAKVFGAKEVHTSRGGVSRNGAYVTIKAKLRLECREELEYFSKELAKVPGVKYLL